ncbi:MAG: STAS domain-containing protein [Vicinamibacterales bacterium]
MTPQAKPPALHDILRQDGDVILEEWVQTLRTMTGMRRGAGDADAESDTREFLHAFLGALESGTTDIRAAAWSDTRNVLARVTASQALRGASPSQTASFVFSLKRPLFASLRRGVTDATALSDLTWAATTLVDALGLFITEEYQKAREAIITRQQQEMLELSTPVIALWSGVLALPVIGTLDSARTQVVMEGLLQRIVDTGSSIAILDITGVPMVDTLVAQHLLRTVAAARLMGADCIISGIRPQIAQTIVHLGVDLEGVTTKATLADAFALALRRLGKTVTPLPAAHLPQEPSVVSTATP